MKVSRRKTEYVFDRETGVTVKSARNSDSEGG